MLKIIITAALLFFSGSCMVYSYEAGGIEIHGFASTGYIITDDNNFLKNSEKGSFEFTEAALNISSSLSDNIRIGLQIYSYDFGDIGNNRLELDWAFLDYQYHESLGVRVGKIKTPHGLYNELQDYDLLYTPILLPQGIYIKYARETTISIQGVGVYGSIPVGSAGTLSYETVLGTMNLHEDGGLAKQNSRGGMVPKKCKVNYMYGGRLLWHTPVKNFLLAFSGLRGDVLFEFEMSDNPFIKMEAASSDHTFLIYSSEYSIGNLTLAGEYWTMDSELHFNMPGMPNMPETRENINKESWYAQISYRFTDWFEAGSYYCVTYNDKYDRKGEKLVAAGMKDFMAWQKDLAISARFDITEYWLLKLEAHFMDGVAWCSEIYNPDGFEDQDWTLFAIKTTFNF